MRKYTKMYKDWFRSVKRDTNRKIKNLYRKYFITLKQNQIKHALLSLLVPYDNWEQDFSDELGLTFTVRNTITKITVNRNSLVTFYTSRPGLIIGKGGQVIDGISKFLKERTDNNDIKINIIETKLFNF